MANDEVYAAGLLNRALDPSTQPPEIRAFLQAEIDLLHNVIVARMRVINVGYGTGRHLAMLSHRLRIGAVMEKEEAHRLTDRMPPNATWDNLMREIYVWEGIERGLADSKKGRTKDVKVVR